MQNFATLFAILTPLFVGFFISLPAGALKFVDKLVGWLVFFILFLIGLSLAQVGQLAQRIGEIAGAVILLFVCTIGMNLAVLMIYDRLHPWQRPVQAHGHARIRRLDSILQLSCVAVGLLLGKLLPTAWYPSEKTATYALMLLIFLVALQLRGSRMTLRQVLFNRRGMETAVLCILSGLAGGLIFAALYADVPWNKGLALASGFGWYSLSGILMTEYYGALWGSIALLNDLARELFALVCIPLLMPRFPRTAVATGGGTALDFTLPVIQASGGLAVVPVAISSGFILNVLPPVLMVVFAALG